VKYQNYLQHYIFAEVHISIDLQRDEVDDAWNGLETLQEVTHLQTWYIHSITSKPILSSSGRGSYASKYSKTFFIHYKF
jgi:hypothetical protein